MTMRHISSNTMSLFWTVFPHDTNWEQVPSRKLFKFCANSAVDEAVMPSLILWWVLWSAVPCASTHWIVFGCTFIWVQALVINSTCVSPEGTVMLLECPPWLIAGTSNERWWTSSINRQAWSLQDLCKVQSSFYLACNIPIIKTRSANEQMY